MNLTVSGNTSNYSNYNVKNNAKNNAQNQYSNNHLDKNTTDVFAEKNKLDADTFKGGNYKRGLKVVDNEILECKRENFESDEAYTNHKKMLLEERQKYVATEAEAKNKKAEGASKVINSTGNLLTGIANVAGKVIDVLVMTKGA